MAKTNQPVADDQELANMLAGLDDDQGQTNAANNAGVADPAVNAPVIGPAVASGASVPQPPAVASTAQAPAPAADMQYEPAAATNAPVADYQAPQTPAQAAQPTPVAGDDLSVVKRDVIDDLRPLVGKLELPPEEKFDTYLLIIRSTDDESMIKPAYDAAKAIPDDNRRAQALLDIIKEIDFFKNPQ